MAGPHAGNRNRPAYSGQARFRFPRQIIELFAPRQPIEFKPPPRKRKLRRISGLAALVHKFEAEAKQKAKQKDDPPSTSFETPAQRRRRVREERSRQVQKIITKARAEWDPMATRDDGVEKTDDAVRTLFVGNVAYTTVEMRLRDEFEVFGAVKKVVMPKDKDGIPRGYAFVEFERERDVEVAYRKANGIKVDGRRLMVDVERGRTVKGWFPNRLDGPHNSAARRISR